MKQLLIEHTTLIGVEKPTLVESIQKNDGRLILRNVLLQRADAPNRNKRVYPKRILEREIKLYENKIMERRAFGELDHPESNIVNLKNVCHAIIDVNWKGNEVYGDVEVLPTPSGNIVRNILLAGFRVGQSSRGLGSVEPLREGEDEEMVEVQDDFELVTLSDCVSDESTIGANMIATGIHESYKPNLNTRYHTANLIMQEIICELSGVCCIK
jgi:hypothetical protein